ncbi:g7123 [Coccomyxa viridis]|uniref:G7123 protein n=1 Tax=Coccomyxa viridis TaxID=1274662 RepID=A0ABP1G1Y5_9CHLO
MTDPVYEESDEEIANLDSEEEESGEDKSDDAQEEALGKLNFMKHGRYEIDEGILAGYTQRNLLDKIGPKCFKECKT